VNIMSSRYERALELYRVELAQELEDKRENWPKWTPLQRDASIVAIQRNRDAIKRLERKI
jgi:hypothetical protein